MRVFYTLISYPQLTKFSILYNIKIAMREKDVEKVRVVA